MSSSLECLQFTHERDRETTKSRRRIKEEGCDDGMVHDGKRLIRERTPEARNDVQPPGSALYDVFKVQVPFYLIAQRDAQDFQGTDPRKFAVDEDFLVRATDKQFRGF